MSISISNRYYRARKIFSRLLIVLLMLSSTSCWDDFPESFPNEYTWKPLLAFPIGETKFGLVIPHGFDTTLLHIDPSTGFPYWNALDSVPMSGGLRFDFEDILGKREEIDVAMFRMNNYNGFPMEIVVQVYMEDGFGNILDSLFDDKLVMARGEVEGSETSKAVLTQADILLDSARLDMLSNVRELTFRGNVKTVPYFHNYFFTVQLAVELGIITEW